MDNHTDTIKTMMTEIGVRAKNAAHDLAMATTEAKNKALISAAKYIRNNKQLLLAANAKDMKAAKEKAISTALLDRLLLNDERIESMAKGLEAIAALPDPVGEITGVWDRPNGLEITRVRIPLGVIGVIYESRPNVTADAGALCLKSGNAAILRGGSESFHSSAAILECLQQGLDDAGLPKAALQRVTSTDRACVGEMLTMSDYIDVIIPRGGKSLIERITKESRIPLFKHLDGICHTYIHGKADKDMAKNIVINAKLRRTGICGATETVLIDDGIEADILPALVRDLKAAGCEIRGDEQARSICPDIIPAREEDWDKEYLDKILSVKTVSGMDQAIDHINRHSSEHTEAIITEDAKAQERFLNEIDSAIVMVNASTQFADGGEFGMGAEIGISTGKFHARGPVGLEQLTSHKYLVRGNGQCRP